jgi:hypothetical protein
MADDLHEPANPAAYALASALIAYRQQQQTDAEKRLQAVTEAVILWRDRPGGDVGLAIALAGILDTEKPEPPAATALVRVLAECDRIEREVHGQHDEDDDRMREAVRRIRATAGVIPSDEQQEDAPCEP